jgi:hypothetical protein
LADDLAGGGVFGFGGELVDLFLGDGDTAGGWGLGSFWVMACTS